MVILEKLLGKDKSNIQISRSQQLRAGGGDAEADLRMGAGREGIF